jgi:hypothetical protein
VSTSFGKTGTCRQVLVKLESVDKLVNTALNEKPFVGCVVTREQTSGGGDTHFCVFIAKLVVVDLSTETSTAAVAPFLAHGMQTKLLLGLAHTHTHTHTGRTAHPLHPRETSCFPTRARDYHASVVTCGYRTMPHQLTRLFRESQYADPVIRAAVCGETNWKLQRQRQCANGVSDTGTRATEPALQAAVVPQLFQAQW